MQPQEKETVTRLIASLGDKKPGTRVEARHSLEKMGDEAVPSLLDALKKGNDTARWEAAKALGHMKRKEAAAGLVGALNDEQYEIQWVAAEGLIALGHDCLVPLLRELEEHPESVNLRQAAHHVLHDLERKRLLDKHTAPVLDALRMLGAGTTVPAVAREALESLRARPAGTPSRARS
jgi:HEAT repeat protein